MENQLEELLESHTDRKRLDEMSNERSAIYNKMYHTLRRNKLRLRLLKLVNYVPAIYDDEIDTTSDPLNVLENVQSIFTQSLSGEDVPVLTYKEEAVVDLGNTLNRLVSAHFKKRAIGTYISSEVQKYWRIEEENIKRRWKILERKELDELASAIGSSVAAQFLYILDPSLDWFEMRQLANGYGLAIKLADNLCDFREDIPNGFVNIPQEDIHHLQGTEMQNNHLINVNKDKLILSQEYMQREFERVKNLFNSTDNAFCRIALKRPFWEKGLSLVRQLAYTWFNQLKEFMTIETLRNYDAHLHPGIHFLGAKELNEIEKKYGVSIKNIISASYKQEARNTKLVRDSDLTYNPYYHEKISEADEKIRALVRAHPGIQEILDFGCDTGKRTVNLYGGKALYGIELVTTAANEARKRGINVYQGSMMDDVYRDNINSKGRKFDLVSMVGEIVNFVGLDTDTLLEKGVEQTRDGGYFLVTSMHPEFEESYEGKYVVWSHTKSTQGKWLLDEAKIPRTFLLLSKQGLQHRLDKVAQHLGCKLYIQSKDFVNNYYENMPLAIYLFKKEK